MPKDGARRHCLHALISACATGDKVERALELFPGMREPRWVLERATCNSLISACARGDQAERALQLFQGMCDQSLVPDLIT